MAKIERPKKFITSQEIEITKNTVESESIQTTNIQDISTKQINDVSDSIVGMIEDSSYDLKVINKGQKVNKRLQELYNDHKSEDDILVKSPMYLAGKKHAILKALTDIYSPMNVTQNELLNIIVMDWYLNNKEAIESTENYKKYKQRQFII